MSHSDRPPASVSLDLDDLWTYMRTHGDPAWASRPSFLSTFVPMALDVLESEGVALTFFIVGSDAADPRNHALLRQIVARGHELGNHSFEHEPWLQVYSRQQLEAEIDRTDDAIAQATGQRPVGFRGPGYSWSAALLEVLADRGYLYDASTLPTYLGPLARAYYFWSSDLGPEQRRERRALFGTLQDGTRPVKPYSWQLAGGRTLLEIPVTTFPVLKIPFHLSYLQYISGVSTRLALGYLEAALAACRLTGTSPSFILHPLDLLTAEDAPQLRFFPAMTRPAARKRALFGAVLRRYAAWFQVVPMSTHARMLRNGSRLAVRHPPELSVAGSAIEK
jgi:peptidoglycan-N-acetylglucosamine deacetylase